ncbi:MAG: FecR domain-containing protein [Verrucomicrobiota bacterium]
MKPLDWARVAGKGDAVTREIEAYARRRRRFRLAAASACVAALLIGGFTWRQVAISGALPGATAAGASTVVSLPARQTLPDGTVVDVKAGAEFAVEFTAEATGPRRVRLRQGEAHFTVTKNPLRPFLVEAGGVVVRAVGTAFSVQHQQGGGGGVEVLVTEGRVALDRPVAIAGAVTETETSAAAPGRESEAAEAQGQRNGVMSASQSLAYVDAGNRALVPANPTAESTQVTALSAAELSERLAWRVARLEFSGTPLAEVIALFNRHTTTAAVGSGGRTTLVLADVDLGALPLSGMLRADNIPVLLQILESSYGIRAERRANGEILLRKGS